MMNKIRQIFSGKLRLSGIRGCMAAGAMTAGIAALAVIGGVNSEDISTVNLETDVIPEETALEAVTEKAEKKTYSHDMEYFSFEDIKKMTSKDEEDVSEAEEINEAAVSAAGAVNETAAEETSEEETADNDTAENVVSEEPETASEGDTAEEDEMISTEETVLSEETGPENDEAASVEDVSDEAEEISDSTDNDARQSEEEQEITESVLARFSAAGGDEDDGGLSSALDLETEDSAETDEADDLITVYSAPEKAASRAAAGYSASYKNSESENDTETEEDPKDEDMNDIPEDITLDDEDEAEESTPAPQEGAISLLELPEWLEFDENGIPTEYSAVLTGNACAYTAAPDALMSTGKAVFQGYVAVDPDIIPYGSELYIVAEDGEVYGYAIAADTGSSVRKGHIIVDLFMNEYDDCIQWGNKPVYVYVLK